MMNEENNMVANNDTTNENGFMENETGNSNPESEVNKEQNENGNTETSNSNSEETGGAPLTNDEIRELMKHGGFNNGMNPEALERLMNQPGPDTKALLERISGVLEIQDGNIGKAFAKINDLELKVTSLSITNRFTTIIAIASIIVAIVAIIL